MHPQDFPFEANGEIDLGALDWQVDWEHPTALEITIYNIHEPDYAKLMIELTDYPRMARFRWRGGKTLLHYAACDCQNELIKLLIQSGADVNANSRGDGSPLHEAVEGDNAEGMKLLIEHGALVNLPDNYGSWPIHKAAVNINPVFAAILIEHSADINQPDAQGQTPLDHAITRHRVDVATMFIAHGAKKTEGQGDDFIAELMRDADSL
jgi:ankyrin repeat protein